MARYKATLYRASRHLGRCNTSLGHGAQTENQGWSNTQCPAQANRRTCFRHHQIRAELPPVLPARLEERHGKMDAVMLRMEFEGHGRIASAVAKTGGACVFRQKNSEFCPFKLNSEFADGVTGPQHADSR